MQQVIGGESVRRRARSDDEGMELLALRKGLFRNAASLKEVGEEIRV